MERVEASNEIEVIVKSSDIDRLHPDIVSGYFSNPRNTGVHSASQIDVQRYHAKKDTFIIAYQSPQGLNHRCGVL